MKCSKCGFDNPPELSYCGKCGTQVSSSEDISLPTETIETPKEELTSGSTFAERYQIATAMNNAILLGFQKALEYLVDHVGIDWITNRIPYLARYVRAMISNMPGVKIITPPGTEAGFVHFHVITRGA